MAAESDKDDKQKIGEYHKLLVRLTFTAWALIFFAEIDFAKNRIGIVLSAEAFWFLLGIMWAYAFAMFAAREQNSARHGLPSLPPVPPTEASRIRDRYTSKNQEAPSKRRMKLLYLLESSVVAWKTRRKHRLFQAGVAVTAIARYGMPRFLLLFPATGIIPIAWGLLAAFAA